MATKSILSDEIEFNPKTANSIPKPASGDYAVFLNSSNSNKLTKKASNGVLTDMETTVPDDAFIIGAGTSISPLTLKMPYVVSNVKLDRNNWVFDHTFYYNSIDYDTHKKFDIIFLTPFYGGDNYEPSLEFYNRNVALFKIDVDNRQLIFAASTEPEIDIFINVLNFYE